MIFKFNSNTHETASKIINSTPETVFMVKMCGAMVESTQILTGSGTTINNFHASARNIVIDLSNNTGTPVTSSLTNENATNGQVVTIIFLDDNENYNFQLTINNYINPANGQTGPHTHTFNNIGESITLIYINTNWINTNWINISASH